MLWEQYYVKTNETSSKAYMVEDITCQVGKRRPSESATSCHLSLLDIPVGRRSSELSCSKSVAVLAYLTFYLLIYLNFSLRC